MGSLDGGGADVDEREPSAIQPRPVAADADNLPRAEINGECLRGSSRRSKAFPGHDQQVFRDAVTRHPNLNRISGRLLILSIRIQSNPLFASNRAPSGSVGFTIACRSVSIASLIFLASLGAIGAKTGGANILGATIRVTFWGALTMMAQSSSWLSLRTGGRGQSIRPSS